MDLYEAGRTHSGQPISALADAGLRRSRAGQSLRAGEARHAMGDEDLKQVLTEQYLFRPQD